MKKAGKVWVKRHHEQRLSWLNTHGTFKISTEMGEEGAFLVAQMVKNPPAMQETQVRSLGWKIPWRRKWQPTPVFLPGELHGQRSFTGYSPWGGRESDMTD